MRPRLVPRIRDIAAADWDALHASPYPFARHAFLAALEDHGCVGGDTGWEPCHLVLEDADGALAAAAPLYRKQHCYGEFVFDFAWADAAGRAGLPYYPKLLCAIPFTPVTGPRFAARSADAQELLLAQLDRIVADDGLSSAHALFLDASDAAAASAAGWLERHDVQFHWHGRGAASFEEFLARLSHDKRKKIRRERRKVAEAGITFEWRAGAELSESQWVEVHTLYGNTYEERGQAPYLTLAFFLDYGRRAGSPVRLILARDGSRLIAVAVTLVGGDTLYGRHWGCAERYDGLHFETCYYQGIELCLAEGLAHFDAGAQGAHKLARGFEPTVTRSAHRLADARLARAIGAFLERERALVAQRQSLLAEHSPYRDEAAAHDG
jgi:predicted N-acyltransferase